jgi:hypothetical protein
MNNMRRRSHRADESFHRNRRRSNVDRSAMLMGPRPRRSVLSRFFGTILGIFSRK